MLSEKAGNVIGPLLSYEVLTAFFMEATFPGVMLFGMKRVSEKLHFFATCMVALGTLMSRTYAALAPNRALAHNSPGIPTISGSWAILGCIRRKSRT